MAAGWQTKALSEVLLRTETVNPIQLPHDEFEYIDVSSVSNETYAVETTQRLKKAEAPSRARRLVRSGDVLLATIRPTLKRITVIPPELDGQICSTGYFVLRPCREIDRRFLFYSLFTERFMGAMETLQKGASYPAVTDAEVRSQPISFPPIAEQRRIVATLDEAFGGIATAKANAEKNLQNARELFSSHLDNIFGQDKVGWAERSLEEMCEKITDGEHLRPKMCDEGVPFLSAKDVREDGVVFGESLFVSEEDAEKFRRRCNPDRGDILIVSRGATVGRTCVVETDRVFCLLGSVILLKVATGVASRFVAYALKSTAARRRLMTVSKASAQQAIYLRDLKPLKINIPMLNQQELVAAALDTFSVELVNLEGLIQSKLAALDELKKSLLNQAFTGALANKSVDKQVAEVA